MRPSISLRRYVAIAAMAVLSVLLLRPACDVLALQSNGAHTASVALLHHDAGASAAFHAGSQGAITAVASAARNITFDAAPIGAALAVPVLVFFSRVAAPDAAAPPPRSYYARSARILR
jgi:hypothetical protein